MNSAQLYAASTAAWLTLQSLPLLLAPRLIITLLSPDAHIATQLETYFARTTALAQLALAALSLINSGSLNTDPTASAETTSSSSSSSASELATTGALILTTLHHAATAVYAYVKSGAVAAEGGGSGMYVLGAVGAGVLASAGTLVLVFGGEAERGSRWPFESAEARAKRKEKLKKAAKRL